MMVRPFGTQGPCPVSRRCIRLDGSRRDEAAPRSGTLRQRPLFIPSLPFFVLILCSLFLFSVPFPVLPVLGAWEGAERNRK